MDRLAYTLAHTIDRLSEALGEDLTRRVALRRLAGGGLGLAITAGGLRLDPALAQSATPQAGASPAAAPQVHRYSVGSYTVRVFNDGPYVLPASFFAVNAPPEALAKAVAEEGQTVDAFASHAQVTLVDTGKELVLFDTGFKGYAPDTGQLFPGLQSEGIALEDISIVVMTHLHLDHLLGALDPSGAPTFPNARYLINRQEREFWDAEPSLAEIAVPDDFKKMFRDGAKNAITGLGKRLEEIEPDAEVASGIKTIAAYGHTPGHLAVEITSGSETLLHVVDAAGDPVLHLRHPDWFLAPDNWPAAEIATRRALFDRAAKEKLLVQTYHFPFPGVGHVAADGDLWTWEPVS